MTMSTLATAAGCSVDVLDCGDAAVRVALTGGIGSGKSTVASVFAALGVHRLLPTRADIARRLGGLLAAAHQGNLSFADVSATADVADGLQPLSPRRLGNFFFPATPPQSTRSTSSRKKTGT